MTKQQEIVMLELFAQELGDNSYTGPWLKEQMYFIKSAIRSDLPVGNVAYTMEKAVAESRKILDDTKREAEKIIADAKHEGEKIMQRYAQAARNIKLDAVTKLKDCIFELEK